MLILKLICNNKERSSKEFKELENSLKNKNIFIETDKDNESKVNICCDTCDKEITEFVFLNISNYIYLNIINNYDKTQLLEFLTETYFFLKQSEVDEVRELIIGVLKKEKKFKEDIDSICLYEVDSILKKIKQGISENEELNIKGFITFRTKVFLKDIESVVDKIVERYMVDKEYVEFIKLMKYFVDIQECKTEKIVITINDDAYTVRDANDNDLYDKFSQELYSPIKGDVKTEDLIMSGLISSAPNYIEIHNKENCKSQEFLDVIEKVFEDKVIYIND